MKEITEADRTVLGNFFGGYFHQDFTIHYSTWIEAVSDFRKNGAKKEKRELIEALERFHDSDLGERKIERVITEEFGCAVWPLKTRGRKWIQMILEELKNVEPNQAVDTTRAKRPELWTQQGRINPTSFSTGL